MSSESVVKEEADMTDDSCILQFVEFVPLPGDSLECDGGDPSVQVKEENLPVIELGPDVMVCYTFLIILSFVLNFCYV